ncbi:MAG: hypothetical protein O3B70_05430 [Bacteroidetes bacterium]|nr:hypothetical protein [Bacteroidota bacterium]MDA0903760.1 hypothetical protein [Bacteroidota bacterium]MDA1242560.1 hypothetical protein [Bacteroidota bacterium]
MPLSSFHRTLLLCLLFRLTAWQAFGSNLTESSATHWWHPEEYATMPVLQQFYDRLRADSEWMTAELLLRVPDGKIRRVEAVRSGPGEGDFYVVVNGDMRWVAHSSSGLSNLSQSLVQGYNGGAKHFCHDGKLHALGGYGLWRRHFDLLRFEGGAEAWQLIAVVGDHPEDRMIDQSVAFVNSGGKVMILDDVYRGVKNRYATSNYAIRTLDLQSRTWSVNGLVDSRLGELNGCTGLGAGMAMHNAAGELIWFDFEAMVAFLLPKKGKVVEDFWSWHDEPGRMTFRMDSGATHWFEGDMLPLNLPWDLLNDVVPIPIADVEAWKAEAKEQRPSTSIQNEREGFPVLGLFVAFVIGGGLMATLFFVLFWRHNRKTILARTDEASVRLSELTLTVQESDLRQLETEELDALLGIDHLQTPETLRSQRARMVSRINTEYQVLYGQDLVVRGQSPEDRRRSVYFIRPV